jgi:hypothetical protein
MLVVWSRLHAQSTAIVPDEARTMISFGKLLAIETHFCDALNG